MFKHFSLKKFLLRQLRYPELLVMLVMTGILMLINSHPWYQIAFLVLFISSFTLLLITTQKRRQITFDASTIMLIAVLIGLLQLVYIPSLCLCLIFFYRLFLTNKKNLIAPLVLGSLLVSVGLINVINQYQIPLAIDNTINWFSHVVSLLTALMFFHQIWYLISRIQELNQQSKLQEERLATMISRVNKLTRFLPPQVWQPIINQNKNVDVVNQRRKLTIFFSDIVGFTNLSDNISPDHLANILNTYFDAMTKITLKYGATLDKFIGDGLLCYFGDKDDSNEREDAIRCAMMAIEMRREMQVLAHQWKLLGFTGLQVRMGINTGYCYVGNFGSRNRMTYTLIGKEANFASRLESAAKPNQILISESTYNLISHHQRCQVVGQIKLKGLQEPVMVWEVLDPIQGDVRNSNWIDYQLSGFNLHLNFKDIRNYDKRQITEHLKQALELLENK